MLMLSEQPMTDRFISAVSSIVEEAYPECEEMDFRLIGEDEIPTAGPAILLGSVTVTELPGGLDLYKAPSVRETVGTAGGLTKLRYAIGLYHGARFRPSGEPYPYTLVTPGHRPDIVLYGPHNGPLMVDIEVSGDVEKDQPEDTTLLSLAVLVPNEAGDPEIWVWTEEALADRHRVADLVNLLSKREYELCLHNGKFDLRWVNALLGTKLYTDQDTMLMHHSMFMGAGEHGLKPLAQRILGAPDWEAGIEKFTKKEKAHYERIPRPILYEYNAQDVYWTWALYHRFNAMLDTDPQARWVYENIEMPASRMLQDVEAYGMYLDIEYTERVGAELQAEMEQWDGLLGHITGRDGFNPRSPVQVKNYLATVGVEITTTNKKNLAFLRMSGVQVEFIDALLASRRASKSYGTYIKGPLLRVRDNRIHAVFMVHGTSTGRLSSRNPNMQNISNDVEGAESLRRCYIATPGKVMVGADYSQAELRVMAELSGDPQMIADLSSDVDFFDNMMPDVFGPDIMKLDKAGRKPYRLRLKRIVYGLSYNRKAGAIAEQLTIEDGTPTTRTEAQAIIDGYLGRYPVFAAWRLSIMPQVLNGELRTVFGRRYQQDVVTNSNYVPVENSALAFPPQSTASDLCLLAAIRLHKELPDGAHMVNLVHDALYTECWPEQAEYVKDLTQRLMEESAREYFSRVTFSTEGKIGLTWDSV